MSLSYFAAVVSETRPRAVKVFSASLLTLFTPAPAKAFFGYERALCCKVRSASRAKIRVVNFADLRPQQFQIPILPNFFSCRPMPARLVKLLHGPQKTVHRLWANRLFRIGNDNPQALPPPLEKLNLCSKSRSAYSMAAQIA